MNKASKRTIVFTDSGLGGLEIMAKLYNQLKKETTLNQIGKLDLIFFNALPESEAGYNTIESLEEKTNLFNSSLHAIKEKYHPDVICVACNSLSALYPNTSFFTTAKNTIEIISHGRQQIELHRKSFLTEQIFILATSTTVESKAYYFADDRVRQISGENLVSLIEDNYKNPEIEKILFGVIKEIKKQTIPNEKITLFLGCTHYIYVKDLILNLAENLNLEIRTILNPGQSFISHIIEILQNKKTDQSSNISIKVESQALITANEVKSISTLLQKTSPEMSNAIENYIRLPKLF